MGYTGGSAPSPDYRSVCAGDGHTEALRIEYDPAKIDYDELLEVFYKHCPAVSKGRKAQYKNAIWYHTEEQRAKAEESAVRRGKDGGILDILGEAAWYDAEDYHQKYYLGGRSKRR